MGQHPAKTSRHPSTYLNESVTTCFSSNYLPTPVINRSWLYSWPKYKGTWTFGQHLRRFQKVCVMSNFQLFYCYFCPATTHFDKSRKNSSMIYKSGLSQTSFDPLVITAYFLWLLTPQPSDKQMLVTNMKTVQGITSSSLKWKLISCPEACLICIWSPWQTIFEF